MSDQTFSEELYYLTVSGYFWSPSDARHMEHVLQAVLDGKARVVFNEEENEDDR